MTVEISTHHSYAEPVAAAAAEHATVDYIATSSYQQL